MCRFVVCVVDYLLFKHAFFSKARSIVVLAHVPSDMQAVVETSIVIMLNGRVFTMVPNSYRRMHPNSWLPYLIQDRKVGNLRHFKAETIVNRFAKEWLALHDLAFQTHLTKTIQYLLNIIFPQLRNRSPRIWWKLENMGLTLRKLPTDLHLCVHIKETNIVSPN